MLGVDFGLFVVHFAVAGVVDEVDETTTVRLDVAELVPSVAVTT